MPVPMVAAKVTLRRLENLSLDTVAKRLHGGPNYARVGLPDDTTREHPDITLAQLGWIHEVGTNIAGRGNRVRIPARPFLIPGIQENRASLQTLSARLLLDVQHGRMSKRAAIGKLGADGEAYVKEKIRNGPFEGLSEATKAARRKPRKGWEGERKFTPLWDTGNMLNNVTWSYDE